MTSTTAPERTPTPTWQFDSFDAEMRSMAAVLQSRGADRNTVMLCLGMSRLDRIIRENRGRKKHVLYSSMPKSGTTYLHKLLLAATGFTDYLIDRFSEDQQQNIIRQWMPMFLAQDTVTQIHMFATRPNVRMLTELGVRPAVLVRNLPDALVSLRDHLIHEDHVVPLAQVPAEFREWSESDQLWFVVRMATPWYLNFFVSWQRAAREMELLWVRYEDLVAKPESEIARVLAHADVKTDAKRIDQAVQAVDMRTVRFNVGVEGRGARMLTDGQMQAIRDLGASYRDSVDFSMIGL